MLSSNEELLRRTIMKFEDVKNEFTVYSRLKADAFRIAKTSGCPRDWALYRKAARVFSEVINLTPGSDREARISSSLFSLAKAIEKDEARKEALLRKKAEKKAAEETRAWYRFRRSDKDAAEYAQITGNPALLKMRELRKEKEIAYSWAIRRGLPSDWKTFRNLNREFKHYALER